MKNKQEYVDYILKNEAFVKSIKDLDDEQREKLTKLAENFASKIADSFLPLIEKVQNDEEYASKLKSMLEERLNKSNSA